jgi:hypothetical protein
LLVADHDNNRVLIWNTIPTTNGKAADVVIGQPDMTMATAPTTPSATTLTGPNSIHVDANGRLYVSDQDANRILYWNAIPTQNQAPADGVIGQASLYVGACQQRRAHGAHPAGARGYTVERIAALRARLG